MQSISEWLLSLGLAQYASVFEDNGIDLEALALVSERELEKLGVLLGHRKKLLKAIAEFNGAETPPLATPAEAIRVTPAHAASPATEGERRQLTVLFCDMVGFTELANRVDPEDLQGIIRSYEDTCAVCITRYEGYVFQRLGDGIVAFFGYPLAHEGEAERAIHAGLEIVETLSKLDVPDAGHLAVRIGIATGLVVVSSAEKGAVGETMNLASRLQGIAQPGSIIVSERVHRLASGAFDYEDLGEHALKGIARPTHAYRILGVSEAASRFEAATGAGLTPLVGREQEIGLLLERWALAQDGEGQVVLLSGEPGIGKSRILSALRERLEGQGAQTLRFQCSPYYINSAFYPSIDNFERALKFGRDEQLESKLDKLEALIVTYYGRPLADVRFIASILSIPCETRYGAISMTSQKFKDETLRSLVDLTEAAARKQPSVMLFEDVHWADPTTLELLGLLIDRARTIPLLIVLTHRPEFQSRWSGQGHVSALNLSKLTRAQSAAMLSKVTGGKALPAELLEKILVKTDGVPLFVEELTKSILESGELMGAGDHYNYTGLSHTVTIPATLRDSLMARLDRFAPVKEIAQIGAAIGREFSYELIAAVAPMAPTQLDDALARLTESGLAFRRGTIPEATYTFKHALVQDAAYESILKSRRRQLHASVATTLERDPQIAQGDPGFLALQFDRAGLIAKAIDWYIQAASKANLRSASKEALHHFQRALALLDDAPPGDRQSERRINLHTEIGFIHLMLEGWASRQAMEQFVEAEKLSLDGQHREGRFRTLVGMSWTLTWRGYRAEAKSYSEELVALSKGSENRIHRLFAHQLRGQTAMYDGDYFLALAELEQANALYDESADGNLAFQYGHDPGMVSLWWTAYMQWETGSLDQALGSAESALRLGRRIGHPYSLASSLAWTVDIAYFMWLPERILQVSGELMDVAQRYSFSQLQAMCSFQHGWALAQEGRYEIAIEQMTRGLDQYKALGAAAVVVPRMTAQLASVYGQAGRAEEGLLVLQSSPDRVPGRKRIRYAEISRIEGDLQLLKTEPDPALAEKFFREAIEIAIDDNALAKQLRAVTSLARLLQLQGKIKEAKELLGPVYDSFAEGFDMPDMKRAKALLENLNAKVI